MAAADISTYSRATQGVRLMRIGDDARVISVARTEKEDEEDVTDAPPEAE
jgi:DNA gyrase subunit A